MIMAAAALMALGCEKNIEIAPEADEAQEVCSLTVSLPTDTKITFDGADGFKSAWEKGDQIKVETSNGYKTFTISSGFGKKKATFSYTPGWTEGSVKLKERGKVFYPAGKWDNNGRYTFASSYVWDNADKFHSDVPMAGTVNGTTATFEYTSGAILLSYSKITKSTAKLVVNFDSNVTGRASLNGGQLSTPNNNAGSQVTIWMNSQHEMIGGTPENAKFLIPLPVGTYSSLRMRLYMENDNLVKGSDFSLGSGRKIEIENKQLKVLPTIVPDYPIHIAYMLDPGSEIENGEYIVVFDRRNSTVTPPDEYGHDAWVNGDDNLREVIPATLETLDENHHLKFTEEDPFYGKTGVILDQADYETGVWKMKKNGSSWTVTLTGKKPLTLTNVEWESIESSDNSYTGYIIIQDQYYDDYYNLRTRTLRYIDPVTFRSGGYSPSGTHSDPNDPIFNNGCFWLAPNQQTNVKLFLLYN